MAINVDNISAAFIECPLLYCLFNMQLWMSAEIAGEDLEDGSLFATVNRSYGRRAFVPNRFFRLFDLSIERIGQVWGAISRIEYSNFRDSLFPNSLDTNWH